MKSKLKIPLIPSLSEIDEYFIENNLNFLVKKQKKNIETTFQPNKLDLYFLHQIIIQNKRTTILELGCGWSTLVMLDAINKNKMKYGETAKDLRRNNLFEIHSVDNYKNYINHCKKNVNNHLSSNNLSIKYSECEIGLFKDRYVTYYKDLPRINPDLIYIDGPSQFGIKENNKYNFNTDNIDFMPMSADVLKIEFFLLPGTIIIIDGRSANVRFLKKMLDRNWKYEYNLKVDQHYLFLEEESFGKINDKIINFWKK